MARMRTVIVTIIVIIFHRCRARVTDENIEPAGSSAGALRAPLMTAREQRRSVGRGGGREGGWEGEREREQANRVVERVGGLRERTWVSHTGVTSRVT